MVLIGDEGDSHGGLIPAGFGELMAWLDELGELNFRFGFGDGR